MESLYTISEISQEGLGWLLDIGDRWQRDTQKAVENLEGLLVVWFLELLLMVVRLQGVYQTRDCLNFFVTALMLASRFC